MPKSKNYDEWVKKTYPRKCNHCDYISNNPSMHSYHKQTHAPIPEGQLCNHGCGSLALFRGTGGKYTCMKNSRRCPAYIKQQSARVTAQWQRPESTQRKEETKKSLIKRLHNEETFKKQSETKRKKFGTLDPVKAKEFRRYARFIRQRAQQWAKGQGYVIGKQTYHIDHKLSILDAWKAGLSEEIVNHPANLQILEAKQNSRKGSNSTLSINELLNLIRSF